MPSLNDEIAAVVRAAVADAMAEYAPSTDVDPLWDTAKVAIYLGITERSVANMRAKGMPYRRIGDVVRFDKAEIDEWTRAQAKGERS
jgi:hypothetical protein